MTDIFHLESHVLLVTDCGVNRGCSIECFNRHKILACVWDGNYRLN